MLLRLQNCTAELPKEKMLLHTWGVRARYNPEETVQLDSQLSYYRES